MNQKQFSFMMITTVIMILSCLSSCKKSSSEKDDKNNNPQQNAEYALVIDNGAQSLESGKSIQYSAFLVNAAGDVQPATGVSWSTSDQAIATISANGSITTVSAGIVIVKASVKVNGVDYQAEAPLAIKLPSLFTVAPSAILASKDLGTVELHPVYFGTATPSYSYQSSNSNIATVSSSGIVTLVNTGNCEITVTANGLDGNPTLKVPVMVVGPPSIPLPIVRIEVSPVSKDMFRDETQTFTAKAYNSDKAEVTTTFNWKVLDPTVGTISEQGVFTAKNVGKTTIQATAEGIIGQAEVIVNPDTLIMIDPFFVTVGAGNSYNLTAKTFKVNRSTHQISQITNPSNLKWEVAPMGISMFDVATVDQTGKVTIKSDAMPGVMAFIMASIPGVESIEPGFCNVNVGLQSSTCDCGSDVPNVHSISVAQNSYSFSMMSGNMHANINGEALDANGDPVSSATIVYCSDNEQVAMVDSQGEITAVAPGDAIITVCVGSVKKTVSVSVTF